VTQFAQALFAAYLPARAESFFPYLLTTVLTLLPPPPPQPHPGPNPPPRVCCGGL
jgi:hypothetical protein